MAASKSNFFKDHYDWLVAIAGLALLAGVGVLFAMSLDSSPEAARAACETELKNRTPAHKDVPAADMTLLEKVMAGLEKPSLLDPLSDKEGNFLASECRVYCQNPDRAACHKPIPYKSKVCPFCGFQQPSEDSAEAVRGGVDADNDGLPDAWELKYGLNPNDPADAKKDSDGDTFTNLEEFEAKTDPKNPDSHPDFLDSLALASALRTEELPFMFKMATPIPNGHRLTFVATKWNQDKKPVIGDAVVKSMATAEVGKEVVFELMKIKYVKGRGQCRSGGEGWRLVFHAVRRRVQRGARGARRRTPRGGRAEGRDALRAQWQVPRLRQSVGGCDRGDGACLRLRGRGGVPREGEGDVLGAHLFHARLRRHLRKPFPHVARPR